MAKPNATRDIVNEIEKLIVHNKPVEAGAR
jgi:hypothetical protein